MKKNRLLLIGLVMIITSSIMYYYINSKDNTEIEMIDLMGGRVVDVIYLSPPSDLEMTKEVWENIRIRETYVIGEVPSLDQLTNEKIMIKINDEIYNQKELIRELYHKGNVIIFVGDQLDYDGLVELMGVALELDYNDKVFSISFLRTKNEAPIITVVTEEARQDLALALLEIDEGTGINRYNIDGYDERIEGELIATVREYQSFEPYGRVKQIQKIYQIPNPHTKYNYYNIINETRVIPGMKVWGNEWKTSRLQQYLDYNNPNGRVNEHITIDSYRPKRGSDQTRGSWVEGATDYYWEIPSHLHWNTAFLLTGGENKKPYISTTVALLINRKNDPIEVMSRYQVTLQGKNQSKNIAGGIGVMINPIH